MQSNALVQIDQVFECEQWVKCASHLRMTKELKSKKEPKLVNVAWAAFASVQATER